jgi:ATP-dependent 26S proteasome regulatory subunit
MTDKLKTPLGIGEIQTEISKTLEKNHIPDSMAQVSYERDEFILRVYPTEIDEKVINEVIATAKKHIENWRIHTFDRNYVSIQALNSSVFQTENLLDNLKIKISALAGEKLIEISKKGPVHAPELNLMMNIIKQFCVIKIKNPVEHLVSLGCPVYYPDREKISLSSFAGYDEVKRLIQETVILPLKNPDAYDHIVKSTRANFESNRPKAVLFSGPPGVGKTTMARILAHETGCYLVYIPLENIMSAYYGESSKRLAMIFDVAASAENEKFILFLDEIDSLAPSRNEKLFEATRRMLSVLLRKIDGIESKKNYITIGATNRKEDIDEALISRFDTVIEFGFPEKKDVENILEMYARHLPLNDRTLISEKLIGISPRTIKDICNRAERSQARQNISTGRSDLPGIDSYIQAAAVSVKS